MQAFAIYFAEEKLPICEIRIVKKCLLLTPTKKHEDEDEAHCERNL